VQAKKEQQASQSGKELAELRNQITVLIPALNQADSIGILIDGIRAHGYDNVIVIDESSIDRTKMIAEERGVSVILQADHDKGKAILAGLKSVKTPYLLLMDADGSYDPADLDRLLPYALSYDFVKGARARNNNMPIHHRFANYIMSRTFNMLFGTSLDDVCSGMYLMRTDKVASLSLEGRSRTVELDIAKQMALSADRIQSVPINYNKRIGGKEGAGSPRQGLDYLLRIFQLAKEHNPLFLFSFFFSLALVPAGLLFLSGLILALFGHFRSNYFLVGAVLFLLGIQGVTLSAISGMFRKLERKLNSFNN
jgi:dolichol-phosphate mannosyltransferase